MAKIASTLILVVVIIAVQGRPGTYDEILAAAKEGQWDQIQEFLHSNSAKNAEWKPAASFDSVRGLKPVDGGHVYGEAEYSYHSASNINGKKSEDHAGHKVINDDGKVNEFDFTPKIKQPLLQPIVAQSQFGNDHSASDYSFNYAPPGVGGNAGYIGGQKLHQGHSSHLTPNLPQLPLAPLTFTGIRDLKPADGAHVYGEAQYSYHTSSNINGQKSEQHGGHKVINDDGKIKEFDFQPDAQKPIIPNLSFTDVRDLKPPQGGQVYGEAQYSYQSSSNINGKTSEDHGGHKIINDNGRVQEFDYSPKLSPVSF